MFTRGVLSLHTAPLSVPKTPTSKSRVSITSKLIENKPLQVLSFGHLRKTGGWGSYPLCQQEFGSPSFPRSFPPISTLASPFFNHLRTLSFFGSQLSRVPSAVCALLRKKPGVYPYVVIPSFFIIVPTRSPFACPERSAPSAPRVLQQGRRACPPKLQRRRVISHTYQHQPRISLVSPTYAKTGGYTPTQKCRRADIFDFSPDISHFLALSVARRVVPAVALAEEGPIFSS